MWRGRGKHQRRSFLVAAISACLPVALIGILVYLMVTDRIEAETKKFRQSQVAFATERIDSNLNHLELAMAQWTFRLPLETNLGDLNVENDYKDVQTIYRALTWVKSSDPLIEEVTLYLENQKVLVRDNSGIIRLTTPDEIASYRKLAMGDTDLSWTPLYSKNANAAQYMLVVRLPGRLAALFVEINAKQLDKLIGELEPEGKGATILLQEEGKPISLGRRAITDPSDLDAKLLESARELRGTAGEPRIERWEGGTYSVSTGSMKRIGKLWTVAAAAPIEQLTKPVQVLSRIIVATGGFGLLLALLLSWLAYRQIYSPFRRLAQQLTGRAGHDALDDITSEWKHLSRESQILQERVDSQLPTLRESFLLQLVQGHLYFLSEKELAERMGQYGWDVRERIFAAMVVQVHGLYESEGRFSEGDEQLVTFAAANIAEELTMGKALEVSVINFQDLTVGLLLRFPAHLAHELLKSGLYHLADELAATLRGLLKVEIAVCVGKSVTELREVPRLFEDARAALNHRKLGVPQQILDVEELMPSGRDEIRYPFEIEKALLQAVKLGMDEELERLFIDFLAELKAQAIKEIEVRQGVMQLCGNVQNTILQAGYNPFELTGGTMLWEEMGEQRDPHGILELLRKKLLRPYLRRLHGSQDMQLKLLIEGVLATIHASYMKDISLESCADLHGTYPKRLSLGFKQVTGQTFSDYLTKVRLDEAKRLLFETDEPVGEIALKVGYQPPYFNRLFKKYEGITPGQFRERQEGQGG
ncbi:helix-turn-helix domain-containing protein [Paenibacillus thalictri]|uniref:AraC family transcriptional regulator n=1 Tax=Paenibacillus thalictri TaxID=2527873 RepID=A0A4Q9DSN8_9BACL|nr:helix-turn-helix domain-containing protein [Paenibacillus thalictri]TBL78499.1 AraC family transcriptional regulator [Paenibacillus thalictri]